MHYITILLGVATIAFPFIHDYWAFKQINLGTFDSLFIFLGFITIFIGIALYMGQKYIYKESIKYKPVIVFSLYIFSILGVFVYSYYKSFDVFSWRIATYELQKYNMKKFKGKSHYRTLITAKEVSDVQANFVADPFIIRVRDSLFCFFEVGNMNSKKGEIGLASSHKIIDWKYQKIVLSEPFHLSFPHVFMEACAYYMIPESSQDSSIRLYVSKGFPLKWKLDTILLNGNHFMDNIIFKHKDFWWLFTSTSNNNLLLYYSHSLHGPWISHPANPIKKDYPDGSRMAGNIFIKNDSLFRFAQDDYPNYGNNIRTFYISKIDSVNYEEKEVILLPDFRGLNSNSTNGVHSCGLIETDTSYVVIIDEY